MKNTVNSKNMMQEIACLQVKPIERVVCSGGGAKGVVYAGAYKAMVATGVFQQVKKLSGASAGAITAALMAFGVSPEDFRQHLLSTNLKQLMGKNIWSALGNNPPGVSFLTKNGDSLLAFIRERIIDSVQKKILSIEDFNGRCLHHKDLNQTKEKLKNPNPCITFADLDVL